MKTALLFPGLGALKVETLPELRKTPDFEAKYRDVCEVLGTDLEVSLQENRDHTSWSLFSALTNVHFLERARDSLDDPQYFTGYSVGQWTALYAAGALSFSELLHWVKKRGLCLDKCSEAEPGIMMAVSGVDESLLENVCLDLRNCGHFAAVSNYNAPGQFTLATKRIDIEVVMSKILKLTPRKLENLRWEEPCIPS